MTIPLLLICLLCSSNTISDSGSVVTSFFHHLSPNSTPVGTTSASSKIEYYIKKLEVLTEKLKARPKYIFDPQYDKVTEEENIALYDLYIEKFKHTIYKYRWNNPLKLIEDGREKFLKLSVQKQAGVLLNIHATFGRVSGGCDFTEIGGPAYAAATVNFSSSVSNWKKHYNNVKIVDTSSSGLWGKYSENLLDIL